MYCSFQSPLAFSRFLYITLLLPVLAYGQNWTQQISNAQVDLERVSFPDINNGWAVGFQGAILHTTNGGITWVVQTSGTTTTLRGVCFASATHGWVCGNGGLIRHTTNGGVDWFSQTSNTNQNLNGIAFSDTNYGWTVGINGTIRHTTNGGASWITQTSDASHRFYSVTCTDSNHVWAVGYHTISNYGIVAYTSNGGTNWTQQYSNINYWFWDVDFADNNVGVLCGDGGSIFQTSNGGATWTNRYSGGVSFYCAALGSQTNGWVGGSMINSILTTTNSGVSWASQATGAPYEMHGLSFPDSNHGWAVGRAGMIMRYHVPTLPTTAPELIEPADSAVNVRIPVTFRFGAVENADFYRIQVSTNAGFIEQEFDTTTTEICVGWSRAYHNIRYYWRSRGESDSGSGPWSPARSFTTVVQQPGRIALLSPPDSAIISSMPQTFQWSASSNAINYHFLLADDPTFTGLIVFDSSITITSYQLQTTLISGQQYYWKVRAANAGGVSQWSLSRTFWYQPSGIGVETSLVPLEYQLYPNHPNPFNSSTTISYSIPKPGYVELLLFDINGNEIEVLLKQHQPAGKYQTLFHSGSLAGGTFFIQIRAGEYRGTRKIILLK